MSSVADPRRLVASQPGAIALGLQPRRVEADDGDEHGQRRHAGGERPPSGARELGGAIAERVGPRADRLVLEEAPQIVGELRHRRVALGRVALQRLGDDGLEVAAQHAPQPLGRRGALLGALGRRSGTSSLSAAADSRSVLPHA